VLIGINDIGEVKVWLNPKYNQYMPKASYSYAKLSSAEKSMVDEIKKIFESKTDKNSIQDKFMLENSTFEGLIAEIEAKYGKENLVNRI
jgi:phage gp16-like protein